MIVSYIIVILGIVVAGVYFISAGNWFERHGGVHRWQMWLMAVGAATITGAAVGMALLPLHVYFVGGGIAAGFVAGAIVGLFIKIPISAQPPPRSKRRADR